MKSFPVSVASAALLVVVLAASFQLGHAATRLTAPPPPAAIIRIQLGADDPPQPPPKHRTIQQPRRAAGPSQAETTARIMLLQHSMGFGGIFAPTIKGFMQSGSTRGCGQYTEYAACQASRAGDGWAADRLQNHQASGEEKDWYDR